ncbi:DUF1214 domain-containing protein [Colwellia piezophila]|uniref:DUF1214 domain-containing protein n=1 Tax=Colwellia piezophila TaxID=211668 RepID=UPI00037E2F25|nr:DUF1214 domain-containing protein [Colwellia piezophila]
MKTTIKPKLSNKALASTLLLTTMLSACVTTQSPDPQEPSGGFEILNTRIGDLTFENSFEHGIPTAETSKLLFNEIDFQRASQAYIWAIPLMGFYAWLEVMDAQGVERGQIAFYETYDSKQGGLTFNTSTPYVLSFNDLRDGPVIIEIPAAPVRGAMHTMWQVGITQLTEPGKYLFVGPGQKTPANLAQDVKVFHSDTNHILFGIRLMNDTRDKRMADMASIKITDINGKLISDKPPLHIEHGMDTKQPRGMAYWEILHRAITIEPVQERDRMMMDMLAPLGIEKGKPFNPTAAQQAILEEAVIVGEAMTKNIDFNKTGRLEQSEYGPEGNFWEIATASTPDQDRGYGIDLDGRAAWFYEAVSNDIAMHGMKNGGWGQVYLDNYRSANGNGLDGGKHYTLNIPAGADYAKTFWTVTVYNVEDRGPITNTQGRADVGSNIKGTVTNGEGGYTFHFSPEKPKDVADANWVQTNTGENWFVYFRAYSPSKAFVAEEENSIVPNFELVK